MTKIAYTIYFDPDNTSFLYKYRDGVCVSVFDEGAWTAVRLEKRFAQEVDIPDSATLLFAGGLPR